MMQMTGEASQSSMISSVRRVQGRAILTLSSGETVSMPRAMLKERPYRSKMPFDRSSFDAFMRERSYPYAMEKAVALLASRARTEKEILDSLRRNAYPETTIARVMAKLLEAGYLNDADFAENWTASRANKGMGSRRIRMELRQKGVDQDSIDAALDHMDDDQVLEGALKVAEKSARGKDLSSPADRQKIMAALARRGYDYQVARQALDRILNQIR